MLTELDTYRLGSLGVRYYAESHLMRIMRQYYELPADEAQGLLAGVITGCLGLWFGKSSAPVERTVAQYQDFWLLGPERVLRIWVRFTDPYFDVIAKVENLESIHPIHAITVGYEEPNV